MNTIRARTESESRRRQIFVYRCNCTVNEAFKGRYPITFGMLNLLVAPANIAWAIERKEL